MKQRWADASPAFTWDVLAIEPYMRYAVDLRPDDIFWPTGDPGWGYGLVCYMTALVSSGW